MAAYVTGGDMLLSSALGLKATQPMLDFVDIDLDTDLPLYIDPIGFVKPADEFAQKCQDDIRDFFATVLQAIVGGDTTKAQELLQALQEPNETHLGISTGRPRGRGIGSIQAASILESLQRSPAAKTGLLSDLTDCALFIEGIGADKVSDITTNIIRRHLIEYTQQQFEFHGIPIPSRLPTGMLWETGEGRWRNDQYDKIPLVADRRVLLVPKRYVRWRSGVMNTASQYYTKVVTNFIKDEQLRTNGSLVRVVKTKKSTKRVVYKKDIKKKYPPTKNNIVQFSLDHPEEYRRFKASMTRHNPVGIKTLVEATTSMFAEVGFCAETINALRAIPTGRRYATDYHHLVAGILTYLLYPHLISPTLELEINQGRKRLDISFSNAAETGFFKDRKDDSFTVAREVVVECKNYEEDLNNPEIDQMAGRFDPRRGRFGIVTCRSISDLPKVTARCRDIFQAQNGTIIVLTDDDLAELLSTDVVTRGRAIDSLFRRKLREISI